MDDHTRWRLLNGLDDIGLTQRHVDDIGAFEARRPAWLPRTLPPAPAPAPALAPALAAAAPAPVGG